MIISRKLHQQQKFRLALSALIAVVAALSIGTYVYKYSSPINAAVNMSFTTIGTHPEANAQPTSIGKNVYDLAVADGNVYMGYGDYNDNTGPVHINPYSISSGSFEGSQLEVPSEEISVFRNINGRLYAPMTDPRLPFTSDVGYSERASDGSWSNQLKAPAIHIYDMASLDGNDLWMVGSSVEEDGSTLRGATAYRSNDGGTTWNVAMTDVSEPVGNGFERYYWVAKINDKIYMQAHDTDHNAPMRSFDGASWEEGTTTEVCPTIRANKIEVFDNKMVCSIGNDQLRLFDGTTYTDITPVGQIGSAKDFYVNEDYLYVLGSNTIVRTQDLDTWEIVSAAPIKAQSIAVDDDYVYLGDDSAKLLRSNITITEAMGTEAEHGFDSCFSFDSDTGTITDYYNNRSNNPANPECPRDVVIPNNIGGVAVTVIGEYAMSNKQLESVTIPDTVVAIDYGAFSNNQIEDIHIPNSVITIGEYSFALNNLEHVIVPSSVDRIDDMAFYDNNIVSFVAEGNPGLIGSRVLDNNSSLQNIVFDGVAYSADGLIDEESCFKFNSSTANVGGMNNDYLKNIKDTGVSCLGAHLNIPSQIDGVNVLRVDDWAFANIHFESVTIPSNVISIGSFAFVNGGIKSVYMGESLITIDNYAFYNNNITSIDIPDSVATIGNNAFANNNLTSLFIPSSTTAVGSYAFYNNNIASLDIESGLVELSPYVFAFNDLQTVVLPDSIGAIGEGAFSFQGTDSEDINLASVYYTRLYSNNLNITSAAIPDGGGYILNPARLIISYQGPGNKEIASDQIFSGVIDGKLLNDYLVVNGPTIADEADMTPLNAYFSEGNELTISPIDIDDYESPQPQRFSLLTGDNYGTFVYMSTGGVPINGDDDEGGASNGDKGVNELSSTGMNSWIVAFGSIFAVVLGAVALAVGYNKNQSKRA